MRIVCHQLAPRVGDGPANLAAIDRAIDEATAAGADLIVLPELATSGYVFSNQDEVDACALDLRSPVFHGWQERLAGSGAVLVAGFPLLAEEGVFNASMMLDETGVLSVYRKVHLWDEEKRWFAPGTEAPQVIDTRHGRLAMLICYDLEFPEMVRGLLLQGAEAIAVPTNWPRATVPAGERPAELHDAMSSARLSRLIIACCDRAGSERGVAFAGGSAVIGPDGWIRAELAGRQPGRAIADISIDEPRSKSSSPRNHTLTDRRPDVYARIARSN